MGRTDKALCILLIAGGMAISYNAFHIPSYLLGLLIFMTGMFAVLVGVGELIIWAARALWKGDE